MRRCPVQKPQLCREVMHRFVFDTTSHAAWHLGTFNSLGIKIGKSPEAIAAVSKSPVVVACDVVQLIYEDFERARCVAGLDKVNDRFFGRVSRTMHETKEQYDVRRCRGRARRFKT